MNHIYEQIDQDLKFTRNHKLTMSLRKEKILVESEIQKGIIQNEIFLLDFRLSEGNALPINENVSPKNGEKQEYPSLSFFDDKDLNYIKERSESVCSPLLSGRYNQILWNSKLKHHDFAKKSINGYLKHLESLTWANSEEFYETEFLAILQNSYCLAFQSKYRLDEHDKVLKEFLNNENDYLLRDKVLLIEFMSNHRYFKKGMFICSEAILNSAFQQVLDKPDFYFAEIIKEIAVKVSPKIDVQPKIWYFKLGQVYEAFAEMRKFDDKTGMIPLKMYQNAMNNYNLAGDNEALESVSLKFTDQKGRLNLARVKLPIQEELLEALNKFNVKRAEKLCERSPDEILDYLVFSKDIFPSFESIAKPDPNEWARSLIYTKIEFDINKNISKRSNSEENLLNDTRFEKYNLMMNNNSVPFICYIFFCGIETGKISFESIINYIHKNTWIGENLEESNSAGEVRVYNWLNLIMPSFYYFFTELETAVKSNGFYAPNFILPIDSISLKFEGMLRDIAKRIGVNTVKTVREDTREMFTEDILREGKETLSKFYDETDFLFFNYVYSKQGINLRNDIAHCYLKLPQNYDVTLMYLLIISILRVGKRSIETVKKETNR